MSAEPHPKYQLWLPRPQDMPWIVFDAFNVVGARFQSEMDARRFAASDPTRESWVADVRTLSIPPRAHVFEEIR